MVSAEMILTKTGVRINWESDVFQNAASSYCKYPRGFRDRFRGSHGWSDGRLTFSPHGALLPLFCDNPSQYNAIQIFSSLYREIESEESEQDRTKVSPSLSSENLAKTYFACTRTYF